MITSVIVSVRGGRGDGVLTIFSVMTLTFSSVVTMGTSTVTGGGGVLITFLVVVNKSVSVEVTGTVTGVSLTVMVL